MIIYNDEVLQTCYFLIWNINKYLNNLNYMKNNKEINNIKLKLWIIFLIIILIFILFWELLWILTSIDYLSILIIFSVLYLMITTYELWKIYKFNWIHKFAKISLIFAIIYTIIILIWEFYNDKLDVLMPLAFFYYIPSLIISFFSLVKKEKLIFLFIFNLIFPIIYFYLLFIITPFNLF